MAARYFVFVEFSDPEVRGFLDRLRSNISGRLAHDTPHITVRGPYTTPPDPGYIAQLAEKLHGQGVLVADAGLFETPKGYAVFLHAKSRLFDGVWWKPDFAGPRHRRIPHITIYETASRNKAMAVLDFLRSENVEIVTYAVELTVYTSRQQTLLPRVPVQGPQRPRLPQERIRFREGLLDRAMQLGQFLGETGTDNGQQLLL